MHIIMLGNILIRLPYDLETSTNFYQNSVKNLSSVVELQLASYRLGYTLYIAQVVTHYVYDMLHIKAP